MQTRKLFFRQGNAPRLRAAMLLTVLGVLAVSCVKDQPEPGNGGIELQVVGTALETPDGDPAPATRATEIDGTFTFDNGDALSLFMRGNTYDDVDNRRVAYSKTDPATGTWTIEGSPILLNDRTAVVSLVYPYKDGATFDNIPFTTGPYSPDKDLLFKQQSVYAAVHEARVEQMQHALTRVKFNIKRDDQSVPDHFTGTGDVESVTVESGWIDEDLLFTEGKLNLSFMAPGLPVTGTQPGNIVDDTGFTLSTTGHTTDLLLVPVAEGRLQYLDLSLVIDGVRLNTSIPNGPSATEWKAGTCYTYNVTVKNKKIEIDRAIVDNWESGTSGSSDVEKPEPASVGDYYYSDGTTSQRLKAGKTAKGIVFWVDPSDSKHYKVAALKEEGKQWSTLWFDVGTGAYAGIRDRTGKYSAPAWLSGKTNREILERWIADDAVNTTNKTIADFPAFQYCDQMGEGWYLPAINELQYLYCAYNAAAPQNWGVPGNDSPPADGSAQAAFNARLTAVGGAALSADKYWSATEFEAYDAYKVAFEDGLTDMSNKTWNTVKVRCIREVN